MIISGTDQTIKTQTRQTTIKHNKHAYIQQRKIR